jgi:hypothetical protein
MGFQSAADVMAAIAIGFSVIFFFGGVFPLFFVKTNKTIKK